MIDNEITTGDSFKAMDQRYWHEREALRAAFDEQCRYESLTQQQRESETLTWEQARVQQVAAQAYAYGVTSEDSLFAPRLPGEDIPGTEPLARFPLAPGQVLPTDPAEVARLFTFSRWAWWHSVRGNNLEVQNVVPECTAFLRSGYSTPSLFRFEIARQETPSPAPKQVLQAVICQWHEEGDTSAERFRKRLESDPQWLALVKEYAGRLCVHEAEHILRDWLFPATPSMVAYFCYRTGKPGVTKTLPRRGVRLTSVVLSPDESVPLVSQSHASGLSMVQVLQISQMATRYNDSAATLGTSAAKKQEETRRWIEKVCRYRLTIGDGRAENTRPQGAQTEGWQATQANRVANGESFAVVFSSVWERLKVETDVTPEAKARAKRAFTARVNRAKTNLSR